MASEKPDTDDQFTGQLFGARLRDLRNRAGLSQGDVATLSGLARNTISDLETSRNSDPRLSTMLRLMRTLEVGSLEELIGDTPSSRLADRLDELSNDTVTSGSRVRPSRQPRS